MIDKETKEVIWKTYPDYPFIEANQFGEIRTKERTVTDKNGRKRLVKGRVLKQQRGRGGYMRVCVGINGKQVNLSVHRIVGTCFVPNPYNLPELNHIDCDPANNVASNLEWCTHEYNIAYREECGTSAKESTEVLRKPLFAINLNTFKILRFESQSEAARQLSIDVRRINSVLKGRLNQTGGYWFTEDESEITKEKIREIKTNMRFYGGVIAINIDTFEILCFESLHEAERQLGFEHQNMNHVLRGSQETTHGFWFCRVDSNAIEKTRAKFGDRVAYKVEKLMNNELRHQTN